MTPFENFFANDFQQMLEGVPDEKLYSCGIRGLRDSSWDRKAAFLVWDAMGRPAGTETAKGAPADDDPFACLEADPVDLFSGLPLTGKTCSECGLYQRQSKSGDVCKNGHGGVEGEEPTTHYWYHPESNSLFTTAPGVEFPKDGLVEHIDKETFDSISTKIAAENTEDHFDIL